MLGDWEDDETIVFEARRTNKSLLEVCGDDDVDDYDDEYVFIISLVAVDSAHK
jgi:hypothetical protein